MLGDIRSIIYTYSLYLESITDAKRNAPSTPKKSI
jgi:hypothetical protein